MNVRDILLLEYSYLSDGESCAGQLCPVCNGGSTGEHSLSVSRDGESILWKCHRASCGRGGSSKARGGGSYRKPMGVSEGRGTVGREHYRHSGQLPEEVALLLKEKYYLSNSQLSRLGWDDRRQRVILPIFNSEGELLGSVARSERGDTPKALMYAEDNAVAVLRNYSSTTLIIVEDIYSAIRASQYFNAAAIMGTHLNDERIDTLISLKCKDVVLALDADAFDKSIGYVKRFRNKIRLTPVKLTKDIKNMTPEELEEFINDTTGT